MNVFRKTNGMGRDGYATTSVYAMVMRGDGRVQAALPELGDDGKHVEFDWSRQVLVLADHGKPVPRVPRVIRQAVHADRLRQLPLLQQDAGHELARAWSHSSYFIGGYAIHGYASVPNYPASHGCLRVPIPNAVSIYNWIDLGDPIYTYQ